MLKAKFGFAIFVAFFLGVCGKLETVDDDELLKLIGSEKYVIVLFSSRDCDECDNYENELLAIRDDLVDNLNSWVVKAMDSQLTRLYSPTREPALVFFRHGIPLLYHGKVNEEMILHTFVNNKEPAVKELTDETFEHLTQAATGATTGDWFVMFYTNDCIDCRKLQARWEAVGAALKSRMNVARVNRGTTGAATARRFNIFHVPTFVLFRQGKLYKYEIHKYDVESFVTFAQDWYRNVTPEKVPHPKTPFDDLVSSVAVYLKENPWVFQLGFATFLLGLIASVIMKFTAGKKSEEKAKPKKDKPKKDK